MTTVLVTAFEQTLLYVSTILILVGTLTVFIVQWVRGRGRRDD